MKLMLQKLIFFVLLISLCSCQGATPEKSVRFKDISTLKIDSLSADIQFLLSSDKDVSITTEQRDFEELKLTSENNVLTVSHRGSKGFPSKIRISVPNTLPLIIDVREKSHIFIPEMQAPVKVTAHDFSEVTIKACSGLSVTLSESTKAQIHQIEGNMVTTQMNQSQFAIKEGHIETAHITVTDQSLTSIAATIGSLKLETKGISTTKLKNVSKALSWAGRGNESVSIQSLSGAADVSANYDSKLYVEDAKLDTLLAATGSTGKIQILGTIKDVALSARGASEIIVDKITGKILGKSQMHKGTIRILNP